MKSNGIPVEEPSYDRRTDVFRRLLFELRFQPLGAFGDLETDPSESLFILLGNPKCLHIVENFPDGLRSFVKNGGAVMIATDRETDGLAGENLKKLAGVTVTGETLVIKANYTPNTGQNARYKESPFCPILEPLGPSILGAATDFLGAGSRPELFRRFSPTGQFQLQVATNAPSYLKLSGGWLPLGIDKLARLPKVCRVEKNDEYPETDEEGPLFAVGGTFGKGRVLVLGDHSIFINRMILPADNNNLEFAVNCLHWLRGGVSTPMEAFRAVRDGPETLEQLAGKRNRVLFWEDDHVHMSFEVPLKMGPLRPSLPSEPALVAAIDKTIAKLEESDSLNHALLQQIDEFPGGRERVFRYSVYLLTFALLAFLSYRFLWLARHRAELAVPLLSNVLREHEPKAPLLDQRRRALLRSGNLWEVGHRLAQECFESAGVRLTGARPPCVVTAQGSRWQRWCVNRRVARLWRLACGNASKPLSPSALHRTLREIEELKTALAKGTIRLMGERPA